MSARADAAGVLIHACRLRQVYILPTIRINDGQYRGKLSYTEVLRAICAGFTKNAEPKACMRVAVDDSCRDGSLGQTTCGARCASLYVTRSAFPGWQGVEGRRYCHKMKV